MNIKELIDKLAEYPDTMHVFVEVWNKEKNIRVNEHILEVAEDTQVPNTVIIKI